MPWHPKQIYKSLFLLLSVFLILLPTLITFNEIATRVVEQIGFYRWMQSIIVPFEVRIVALLASLVGVKFIVFTNGLSVKGAMLFLSWNCLGWQSLLLLMVTLIVGFKGANYTTSSKIVASLIGLLGTFLVNIFRLVFIVSLFYYAQPIYGIIYHNYLAAIVTIIWLFIFWWFTSRFVLQSKPN